MYLGLALRNGNIDTAACARARIRPESLAEAIARAGLPLAQFRHKGPFTREVFERAEGVRRILGAAGVRCIINDRADVALMLKAGGVHLGQEDLPPAVVRRIFSGVDRGLPSGPDPGLPSVAIPAVVGSGLIIGYSTHNREQLVAAGREPVDYLAIGPMFPTESKQKPDPVVGVPALAALRLLAAKPLVAIGGITRANVQAVLAAGADAVAVISDLLADDLDARLQQWLTLTQR